MRTLAVLLLCMISYPALADLDRAIDAYNRDDLGTAIAQAEAALEGALSTDDRLLAEEIRLSARYHSGDAGTAFRDEVAALDRALADRHGTDAVERLGVLFILADLEYQLGAFQAALQADTRTARIAYKAQPDATEDLLWAVRNLAIAFDDERADIRSALAFSALFEFFAVDILGMDDPFAQEAIALSATTLLSAGQDTRAAQKFFLYSFERWQEFAAQGSDEEQLATRLITGLEALEIDDQDAWIAEVQTVHDAYLERERLAAEIGELVAEGALNFASPAYQAALARMNDYVAIADPEDPVTAIFLNMILRSHLQVGDFASARPYLGALLAYPVEYVAVLDLPLGELAGAFALRGGVEDAVFEPLLQTALDLEQLAPGDDPDLPFDLSYALAQIAERQGNLDAAFQQYSNALDAARVDGVRRLAVNQALFGAAGVAA